MASSQTGDDSFYQFISLGDKKDKTSIALFENYSRGLETNRDAWCYNFSRTALSLNIDRTLNFYNSEVDRFVTCDENMKIEDFLDMDLTKISWNRSLKKDLERNKKYHYDAENLVHSLYRPFSKSWVYCAGGINAYLNQIPKIFPKSENFNKLIYCSGAGNSGKEFSTIITDKIPDLNMQHSGGQGFPLFIYDEQKNNSEDINATQRNATQRNATQRNATQRNATQRNATLYNRNSIKSKFCYLYIHNGKQGILSPYIRQHSRCTVTSQRSMLPALSVRNGQREQTMNLAICLSITGNKSFSALITDQIPDLHLIGDAQCFPLYLYEIEENN